VLSITTDYKQDTGCPQPYLVRISEAGFTHVHWCHHWHTDFLYSDHEIDQIAHWLTDYGLQLNDLHGSTGVEKSWKSPREYERRAGVELVKNRIHMANRLGTDVVILHIQREPHNPEENATFWSQFHRSLDEIEPYAQERGIRIALENLDDNLGICYDAGHANYIGGGLEFVGRIKDRLISIHLHDNKGSHDEHNLPFTGTVDWERLTQLIAQSAYTKCVNLEVVMVNSGFEDELAFLEKAFESGTLLARMVADARRSR
jgi:sugar phosphate isomerase/epimerase